MTPIPPAFACATLFGAVTSRVAVVVLPSGVPVIVIGYVPTAVAAVVAIVSVRVHVGVHATALKAGVAPLGSPEAARLTACGVPPCRVAVIDVAPMVPRM